jgi:hypothetical protein
MKSGRYIDHDRTIKWYLNDKLHREEGPAVEYANGLLIWYKNGKLHREGGPAVEYSDGTKQWFLNGKYHREDGPAIEYTDGSKAWYVEGKELEIIPQEVLENYMKVNNYTLAHLLTDPDPLVRESIMKYKWEEVI